MHDLPTVSSMFPGSASSAFNPVCRVELGATKAWYYTRRAVEKETQAGLMIKSQSNINYQSHYSEDVQTLSSVAFFSLIGGALSTVVVADDIPTFIATLLMLAVIARVRGQP
jgi:hypothetical protein